MSETVSNVECSPAVSERDTKLGPRVYLLYLLTHVASILIWDIDVVLRSCGQRFSNEKKRFFTRFWDCLKQADGWYDKFFPHDTEGAIDGDFSKLDGMRRDANQVIRLLMYWIDRTEDDGPLQDEVFAMLRQAPEGGRYPQDVIDRFNFGRDRR